MYRISNTVGRHGQQKNRFIDYSDPVYKGKLKSLEDIYIRC